MRFVIAFLACLAASHACGQFVQTNARPEAPIRLIKPTGKSFGYGFGASTDAARGTALLAAQTAAAAGDLIEVNADCDVGSAIGKHQVNYHFGPVTITATGTANCLSDGNTEMDCTITGGAIFTTTDGVALSVQHDDSDWVVKCRQLNSYGTDNAGVFVGEAADVVVYASQHVYSDDYDGVWVNGDISAVDPVVPGTLYIETPFIDAGDDGIETTLNKATVRGKVGRIISAGRQAGGAPNNNVALELTSPGQVMDMDIGTIDGGGLWAITVGASGFDGELRIGRCLGSVQSTGTNDANTDIIVSGCTFDTSDTNTATMVLTSGHLVLKDCNVVTHDSAATSILSVGATIEVIGSLYANKAISGVTIDYKRNPGERYVDLIVVPGATATSTGDGKAFFRVSPELAGGVISSVWAAVNDAGTTGTLDVQIRKNTSTDVLSTKLTIDSGETTTSTAATTAVINTSNDDLAAGDVVYVDIDAVHSGTAANGLQVTIGVTK